jgi:hypothetical protein
MRLYLPKEKTSDCKRSERCDKCSDNRDSSPQKHNDAYPHVDFEMFQKHISWYLKQNLAYAAMTRKQ